MREKNKAYEKVCVTEKVGEGGWGGAIGKKTQIILFMIIP